MIVKLRVVLTATFIWEFEIDSFAVGTKRGHHKSFQKKIFRISQGPETEDFWSSTFQTSLNLDRWTSRLKWAINQWQLVKTLSQAKYFICGIISYLLIWYCDWLITARWMYPVIYLISSTCKMISLSSTQLPDCTFVYFYEEADFDWPNHSLSPQQDHPDAIRVGL